MGRNLPVLDDVRRAALSLNPSLLKRFALPLLAAIQKFAENKA